MVLRADYLEDHCSPLGTPTRYEASTAPQTISFGATNRVFRPELRDEGCRAGLSFSTFNESLGFLVTLVSLDVPQREAGNCSDFVLVRTPELCDKRRSDPRRAVEETRNAAYRPADPPSALLELFVH